MREGANATDGDRLGVTPLMAGAARNSDPQIIALLLGAGADAGQRNTDGMSALALANANPRLKGTAALGELEHTGR